MKGKQGYAFLRNNYSIGDIYYHNTAESRWCCVDDYVHNVFVDWPGHLYRVEIIDFVSTDDPPKLKKNPGYMRALSFRIVEVLPVARLFGEYGENICSILDWIQTATVSDFEKIGNLITDNMSQSYSKAWDQWLKTIDPDSCHLGHPHDGVIAIPTTQSNSDSPIYKGFFLISDCVDKRAEALVGDDRWTIYVPEPDDNFEEDDDPRCLKPLWRNAKCALLYAAMGFGAKDYLTEDETSVLLYPWVNR